MLIDDITIAVKAGRGGRGAVAFNKNLMSLGPTGGSGGKGGDVVFEGTEDITALKQFRYQKRFEAENGGHGKPQYNDGADGKDLVVRIPAGTVIHALDAGMGSTRPSPGATAGKASSPQIEIEKIGQRVVMARGGRGGKGNFHFRSPRNTTPKQSQPGLPGEAFTLRLELKLIADVGLVGLPNAGKSSLLNALTNARSKVANYPFTTLEPHLGAYYGLILADIPGLIEGASGGKGLGVKFLRHVERTRVIFHLVSADSDDPVRDYRVIRNELGAYRKSLLDKPEHVFLSKHDVTDEISADKKLAALKKAGIAAGLLSIYDDASLKNVRGMLDEIRKEKTIAPKE